MSLAARANIVITHIDHMMLTGALLLAFGYLAGMIFGLACLFYQRLDIRFALAFLFVEASGGLWLIASFLPIRAH